MTSPNDAKVYSTLRNKYYRTLVSHKHNDKYDNKYYIYKKNSLVDKLKI